MPDLGARSAAPTVNSKQKLADMAGEEDAWGGLTQRILGMKNKTNSKLRDALDSAKCENSQEWGSNAFLHAEDPRDHGVNEKHKASSEPHEADHQTASMRTCGAGHRNVDEKDPNEGEVTLSRRDSRADDGSDGSMRVSNDVPLASDALIAACGLTPFRVRYCVHHVCEHVCIAQFPQCVFVPVEAHLSQ